MYENRLEKPTQRQISLFQAPATLTAATPNLLTPELRKSLWAVADLAGHRVRPHRTRDRSARTGSVRFTKWEAVCSWVLSADRGGLQRESVRSWADLWNVPPSTAQGWLRALPGHQMMQQLLAWVHAQEIRFSALWRQLKYEPTAVVRGQHQQLVQASSIYSRWKSSFRTMWTATRTHLHCLQHLWEINTVAVERNGESGRAIARHYVRTRAGARVAQLGQKPTFRAITAQLATNLRI